MELNNNIIYFIQENRGKVLGGLFGLVFALLIVIFGFWKGLLIVFCVIAGVVAGGWIESNEKVQDFFSRLWNRQSRY
jgi:uncharacterized membrane protein